MQRNKRLWIVIAVALLIGLGAWLLSRSNAAFDTVEPGAAANNDTREDRRTEGRASARPDLALAPKAAISGSIRDPQGTPIASAQVCVWLSTNDLEGRPPGTPRCTKSESDGHYRLEGLTPIRVGVYAEARGFIPQKWFAQHETHRETQLQLVAGATRENIDFVLRPGGVALHGVVRDISGGVIEGAFVWSRGADFQATGRSAAVSDSEGRFTLWSEPGRVNIVADADGYASNTRLVAVPGSTADIFLAPESVINGRVVLAATGEPVAGVTIEAKTEARGQAFADAAQSARSDDAGNFRINKLQPGIYTLGARGDSVYGEAPELVHLGLAETAEGLVIELHPAFMVSGQVMVAGRAEQQPCAQGWVRLEDRSDKRNELRARINADGEVELRSVLPGTYEVVVRCEGMVPAPDYPDVVITDANVIAGVWEVREGLAIRGVVVDANGSAIEGINVATSMKADPEAPRNQVTDGRSEPSLADGSFSCSGLLPGTYEVWAPGSDRSLSSDRVEVVLESGADINDVRVEVPTAGTITGVVSDAGGWAVGGVALRANPIEGFSSAVGVSGDDGRFIIDPVPPGKVRIFAVDSGGVIRAPGTDDDDEQGTLVEVEAGETIEVSIVLESRQAEIRGRVLDEQGAPVTDAFVNHQRMSDSAKGQGTLNWSADQAVLTDFDGRFVIEGLAQDALYALGAFRKGGGEVVEQGIRPGEAVELTIVETGELAGKVVLGDTNTAPERFKLTVRGSGGAQGLTRTDELFRSGGKFRMKALPPGTYVLIVESPEGDARVEDSELGVAERVDGLVIELSAGVTVSGRVIDLETRDPVAGMTVTIIARGTTARFGPIKPSDQPRTSDVNGRFKFANAPTGNVRIWLEPRNPDSPYDWQWVDARVPESNEVVDIGNLAIIADQTQAGEEPGDIGFEVRTPQPDAKPEDYLATVALVRPGGPAEAAGLAVGDEIQTVNGHDVQGTNSSRFPRLTKVPPGATVKLGLVNGRTVTITAGP